VYGEAPTLKVEVKEDSRRITDISSLFESKNPEAIMKLPADTISSHSCIK